MRKIDKSKILAKEYKAWIDAYDTENKDHPVYNSSSNKYYYDILVNLLFCQGGLCAYTEIMICDMERCGETKFSKEGVYQKGNESESGFFAQLDHFDSSLKKTKGWSWDNFFAVYDKINTRKNDKEIFGFMKPDNPDYAPQKYLEYDFDKHIFYPRIDIQDDKMREEIGKMISSLGLNYGSVIDKRRNVLSPLVEQLKYKMPIPKSISEFPTAFEMTKRKLNVP